MRLDDHQQAIIDTACALYAIPVEQRQSEDVVLNTQAVAGAGKSLVVTELTRRLATANFLFLCKSDNIADRARATLPPSVKVETIHEAARRFVMVTHAEKVSATQPLPATLADRDIRQATDLQASSRDIPLIRRILTLFYRSSARTLDIPHVEDALISVGQEPDTHTLRGLLPLARKVWQSQTRRSPESAPLCRSAAGKLWTLGRNTVIRERSDETGKAAEVSLSPLGDADVVIVEEAQDLDAAMIGFIARQNRVVLMFGDDMQSLDADAPFRHQEHSLQRRGHNFTLHHSYRFSGDVPTLLTALRSKEAGEDSQHIRGMRSPETQIIGYSPEVLQQWVTAGAPVTVIAPSVTDLMALALTLPHASIAWVDGLMAPHYHFQTLFDLACLTTPVGSKARSHIKSQWLRQQTDIAAVHQHFAQRGTSFTATLCEWVLANTHIDLVTHLHLLRQRDVRYQHQLIDHASDAQPSLTLTTVRAAKGHEWPTVAVMDAFSTAAMQRGWYCDRADADTKRQLRWLYTAISRAEHTVMAPKSLIQHCQAHGVSLNVTAPGEAIKAIPQHSDHPYFGMARLRVLEMSGQARNARRQRFARHKRQAVPVESDRRSGQTVLKQQMEQGAKSYEGISAIEHLSLIKKLTSIK
jgi:hypothetical protein